MTAANVIEKETARKAATLTAETGAAIPHHAPDLNGNVTIDAHHAEMIDTEMNAIERADAPNLGVDCWAIDLTIRCLLLWI